jgi:2-acylglycerol O-acyltransferase 2
MLRYAPMKETLYLKKRQGFIRLAIETGRPLVPVFAFGESMTFRMFTSGRGIREWISRRFRIAAVPFCGRFYSVVPFQVPIHVVVGPAVPVIKRSNPTKEEVAEVHDRYIAEVAALFQRHKHEHPMYEGVELVIE